MLSQLDLVNAIDRSMHVTVYKRLQVSRSPGEVSMSREGAAHPVT